MDAGHQASLSFTISQTLLKHTSIELVMLSKYMLLLFNRYVMSSSFATTWTNTHEAPLSMKFSTQE